MRRSKQLMYLFKTPDMFLKKYLMVSPVLLVG